MVPLHPTDRDEIRSATFSPHDAVYLAECLYLRDAARSLVMPGLSPEQLADLGFAWVCRQVILDPWLVPINPREHMVPVLSPAHILRRGSGSGLERMYVFLALLQQMGLKGCLIGPPSAAANPATYIAFAADKKTVLTGAPRGPFWAVGVRVERGMKPDIKLYDPWRGEAFPATWNELRSNPGSHTAWFDDPATVSGIRPDDLKTASVCLAVPVNSLSPRMAMMEKKLKEQVDVKLGVNPEEFRTAFAEAKPAFWNPPGDNFAYGRAARAFLPIEQGGEADRFNPAGQALYRRVHPRAVAARRASRTGRAAPESGRARRRQGTNSAARHGSVLRRVHTSPDAARTRPARSVPGRLEDPGSAPGRVRKVAPPGAQHAGFGTEDPRVGGAAPTELYRSLGSDPNARALHRRPLGFAGDRTRGRPRGGRGRSG